MQGGFHRMRPLARREPRAILGPMSTRLRRISLPKGSRVFAPGEPCPGFVLLDSGTIRVSLAAENGREVVLYRVQPGDVCLQTFSCLINHTTYRAEGVAETDLSGTLLPPELFHTRMAEDPDFRADIFGSVARRFGDFEQLVEDVALIGFDARLARTLLRLRDTATGSPPRTSNSRPRPPRAAPSSRAGWRSSRGPGSSRRGAAGST
jgi:CRP-like cAMP-binding protein